jgi:hypothetical protein
MLTASAAAAASIGSASHERQGTCHVCDVTHLEFMAMLPTEAAVRRLKLRVQQHSCIKQHAAAPLG